MNWYYAQGGQQAGPIDDVQFQQMVADGRLTGETLVWREGMPNWQSYREVVSGGVPSSSGAAVTEAVCAECNRVFRADEMIRYGAVHVCPTCKPVFMQKLSEGAAVGTTGFRYAGFWIRVGAKLIDGLILGVLILLPVFIFAFRTGLQGEEALGRMQAIQLVAQLIYILINCAYTIFFIGKYGATPGKMACKLQVVVADGTKVSYPRATGRFFAEMLSGLICYIGYIMAGFDAEKRALHDHICNTRVIYKP